MHDYLNKRQIKALEVLKMIKTICEKYNIRYFLLAGSALGAVRHQGFIPWDDDIDVGVQYEDWYKLRKILINELPSDYVYMDNIVDPNFPRFQGKVLYEGDGVLDVFLLVKWTSNKFLGYIYWQIKGLAIICSNLSVGYSLPAKKRMRSVVIMRLRKFAYSFLKHFLERDDFIKMARRIETRFNNQKTDYYINIYSVYSMEKEMIKKEWLENISLVFFEGDTYPAVSDTDAYLTHLYGDYMKLPAEENRISAHEEKFYDFSNH